MNDRVARITGREQDLQSGIAARCLFSQCSSVHPTGNDNIREQKIDMSFAAEDVQCCDCVAGLKDAIAQLLQRLNGISPEQLIVLDDQHGFGPRD